MYISSVLALVDAIKPNTYDENIKIQWLSDLDGKIFNEVILTHERDKDEEGNIIGPSEVPVYETTNDELIVSEPYADIYRNYLFAMIDFSNGESDKYTNSMIIFNNSYKSFTDYYNRTHLPNQVSLKVF